MNYKNSGGTNITPIISSMILLSARISMDHKKLLSQSIKLSSRAPKKILLNTVKVFQPKLKLKPERKAKPKAERKAKPKAERKAKKMKGGGSQEFFE
mgnify:CR=1 FL=1